MKKMKQLAIDFSTPIEPKEYTVSWTASDIRRNYDTNELIIEKPTKKTSRSRFTKKEAEEFVEFLKGLNYLVGTPIINHIHNKC